MQFETGVHRITTLSAERLVSLLILDKWLPFVLEGDVIVDRRSFFEAARSTLPTDPPLQSDRSWDALSDSLWGGIEDSTSDRIAIVWKNSFTMELNAGQDFEIAIEIFKELVISLGDIQITDGHAKQVCIILT